MATWKFSIVNGQSIGIEDLFTYAFDQPNVTATATTIRLSGANDIVVRLTGSGFNNTVDGVTQGTISGFRTLVGGELAVEVSGLNLPVQDVISIEDDPEALAAVFLRGKDRITGTSLGEDLLGFGNSDTIFGGGGADTIYGQNGNDRLYGGGGSDYLIGGSGGDTISSGAGKDTLEGGAGADRFVFDVKPLAQNADLIFGFTPGQDKIVLDQEIFTQIGPKGALAAGRFVAGTEAGDANDRIIYDAASHRIWYDADGSGSGAKKLIVTLDGPIALTAADIQIIG